MNQHQKPIAQVISLQRRRASDTIRVLCKLLDQARAGQLRGLVYVAKYSPTRHDPGITGEYLRYRMSALGAVTVLSDVVKDGIPDNGEE